MRRGKGRVLDFHVVRHRDDVEGEAYKEAKASMGPREGVVEIAVFGFGRFDESTVAENNLPTDRGREDGQWDGARRLSSGGRLLPRIRGLSPGGDRICERL